MLILGIDGGFTEDNPTGVAIVDCARSKILYHNIIMPPKKSGNDWLARISYIARSIREAVSSHSDLIEYVAYELPWVGKNSQTAIKLAHVCGAVVSICEQHNLPVVGVTPLEGKKVLTGSGRAEKEHMIVAVKSQFKVTLTKDAADAVGVALAGFGFFKNRSLATKLLRSKQ